MSLVTEVSPAPSATALAHFEAILAFETDCWDVHEALKAGSIEINSDAALPTAKQINTDFVLLDVRGVDHYAKGHIAGAVHLPRGKMIASRLAQYPADTIFVTYCAGPHCNGATRAAIVLARLGRLVKTMPGGITGWLDEGFPMISADEAK